MKITLIVSLFTLFTLPLLDSSLESLPDRTLSDSLPATSSSLRTTLGAAPGRLITNKPVLRAEPRGHAMNSPAALPGLGAQDPSRTITFSEFPVGTRISNQYQNIGIIFGGSGPFISPDGSNPTSPVLSGTPRFQGNIMGTFVEPETGRPTVVQSFTLDAGFFDVIGTTRIEWFDAENNKLGQRINRQLGIERFTIEGGNIASWRIGIVETEPAGFAIDNVSFVPLGPSVLFRERSDETKNGTFGLQKDEIPGFDHSAFQIGNLVYESHPGNPTGTYVSADGKESIFINQVNGVQAQHSRGTFSHDSMSVGATPVVDFEEIPINSDLARKMRDALEAVRGRPFQFIDYSFPDGLATTLAPAVQKGGRGSFTCVGLVEYAAEQAGHNGGQGFIRNSFESFTIPDPRNLPSGTIEVPLLSPQLLNYSMKTQQLFQSAKQWVQGLFDPVDFIVTDPLGRKLGFVQGMGRLNEIPNAFYSGDGGVEQFLILNAIPGNYSIQRVGVGAQVFSAVGSLGSAESFEGRLEKGQSKMQQLFVEPKAGTGGDVDIDGDVDANDITALNRRLNRFTDGLGDPGDLNGDGLLSNVDVTLLTRLVGVLGGGSNADLGVTINATPNTVESGKNLTYTIQVNNNGPDSALGVVVTDNLPNGVSFASCAATNGGVCNGSGANRTITFASLAAGQTATITLGAIVNCIGVTGATLTNTATVMQAGNDPNPANNTATSTVNLAPAQVAVALEGGGSTFEFGPVAAVREANPNPPTRLFTLSNPGCQPLNVNFAFRRTGPEVTSGKVTDADDGATFQVRILNADGSETPVTSAQVLGGQPQRFRVVFNPLVPAPAGRVTNLFAPQVIPDLVNSVLTITPNAGAPLSVPLLGRVTTDVKLINPLAPRLAPLVVLAKTAADEFSVEFSAHDANLDIYYVTYQFLNAAGAPVGDAPGFDLAADIAAQSVVKGQSFSVVKRFAGASRRPEVNKVRVTLFDRLGNVAATSPPIGTQNGRIVNVSAASFSAAALAPGSIVAAFGQQLATTTAPARVSPLPTNLAGTRVYVTDSRMVEHSAPLFFVAPSQVNYQLPPGVAPGAARVTIAAGDGTLALGTINVTNLAPALFAANANGQGVPVGVLLRVRGDGSQVYEAFARYDQATQRFVATPIDLGPANEQVYLILFGTGWRNRSATSPVVARAVTTTAPAPFNIELPVLFAGAQGGLVGVDQLNLRLPRTLLGRGELEISLTVEGRQTNAVRVLLR